MILSKGEMSITLKFCRTVVSWKQAFAYCTLSISFSNPISAFRETVNLLSKKEEFLKEACNFHLGTFLTFHLLFIVLYLLQTPDLLTVNEAVVVNTPICVRDVSGPSPSLSPHLFKMAFSGTTQSQITAYSVFAGIIALLRSHAFKISL